MSAAKFHQSIQMEGRMFSRKQFVKLGALVIVVAALVAYHFAASKTRYGEISRDQRYGTAAPLRAVQYSHRLQ